MDVSKITLPGTMTAADMAFEALTAQMAGDYAWFGSGTLTEAEIASLDSAFAWDAAIAANFDSLGELGESAGKVESKLASLKTRNYKLPGKRTTTMEINLVGISQLQKQYLESNDFSATTMSIILRNREKDRAIVFNGQKWTADWSGAVDGLFSVVLTTEFVGGTSGKVLVYKDIVADATP